MSWNEAFKRNKEILTDMPDKERADYLMWMSHQAVLEGSTYPGCPKPIREMADLIRKGA